MSDLYDDAHRALQERFDTRRLADRLEESMLHDSITESEKAFIESRMMFFLATVDAKGHVNCSYRGGDPGFVRVVDEHTIAFPNYDGNGMYLSMGAVSATRQVGILFIDFEHPQRMRFNGEASIDHNDPGTRDLCQLPALHTQDEGRRALALRAKGRLRDAGTGMEDRRVGGGRAAGG